MTKRRATILVCLVAALAASLYASRPPRPTAVFTGIVPVRPAASDAYAVLTRYNAAAYIKADGTTDDRAALQALLNTAGASTLGAVVQLPPASINLASTSTTTLNVPTNVQLVGSYRSDLSHNGYRDGVGTETPTGGGTVLLLPTGGSGTYQQPYILLNTNATLEGCLLYQPGQLGTATSPTVGPPAVGMYGKNPTVRYCEFLNTYWAISIESFGGVGTERPVVEHCTGQPIGFGITCGIQGNGGITDCVRITDVHWNPWFSYPTTLSSWQFANGIAYAFGDTDETICRGLFAYGYKIGMHFTSVARGTYGSFVGGGMDFMQTCVQIDGSQPQAAIRIADMGLVCSGQGANIYVNVTAGSGMAHFTSCDFWSAGTSNVINHSGTDLLKFTSCQFQRGQTTNPITVSGRLVMTACDVYTTATNHVTTTGSGAALIDACNFKGGLTHTGTNITVGTNASF
jgi:hypothetical protein